MAATSCVPNASEMKKVVVVVVGNLAPCQSAWDPDPGLDPPSLPPLPAMQNDEKWSLVVRTNIQLPSSLSISTTTMH